MSVLVACARMSGAGQMNPSTAMQNRTVKMMNKLNKLEDRYVKDWTDRIDLEVNKQDAMTRHVSQAEFQTSKKQENFRSRNESWAARAEAAHQWREYCASQKLERCQSNVECKQRKVQDYDDWHRRVFVEAPRNALQKRTNWLASQQNTSIARVDKHHTANFSTQSSKSAVPQRGYF
eukprot:TRINITY_DN72312_c0_g1_i1.p1 TRINITY_DN72312_c0_g1~~TRINITY_DN72312_c0_g1_i1.p1  ORF type:complete len:177 (-),score=29.52 TRINITY_DN72312_c0_g1_i1:17-547(-)